MDDKKEKAIYLGNFYKIRKVIRALLLIKKKKRLSSVRLAIQKSLRFSALFLRNIPKKMRKRIIHFLRKQTHRFMPFLNFLTSIIYSKTILSHFIAIMNFAPRPIKILLLRLLALLFFVLHRVLQVSRRYDDALYLARFVRVLSFLPKTQAEQWEEQYVFSSVLAFKIRPVCAYYKNKSLTENSNLALFVGMAFLLNGDFNLANQFLNAAYLKSRRNTQKLQLLGITKALLHDLEGAKACFAERIAIDPTLLLPHQNLAARYDLYFPALPTETELNLASTLQIYDQLNYIAEQMTHHGNFNAALLAYKCALIHQKSLKHTFPLPNTLLAKLKQYPQFDEEKSTAILPLEWVTQIGHIGTLDTFLKIEYYERNRQCNYIVLAPNSRVANQHFLNYWRQYFIIIQDDHLIRELLPYQRTFGESFIPFLSDDGQIESWTRAGSRALVRWTEEKRLPLISLYEDDKAWGQKILAEMGLPVGAWFVVLHVREGSFYNEIKGTSSDHRNADIRQYWPAIQEITHAGGWVIRVGDAKMTPLPAMPGMIDYAHSTFKSERMDIFLLAAARFFIGTTSGLTYAAMPFGTPALLINTISCDWQLWHDKTYYLPKIVVNALTKKILPLSEIYTTDNRFSLIRQELIRQKHWEIKNNDAEDIKAGVRHILNVLDNKLTLTEKQRFLLDAYRKDMQNDPYAFGAAHIVPAFLERHPALISQEVISQITREAVA